MSRAFPSISDYNQAIQQKGSSILQTISGLTFLPSRKVPVTVYSFGSGSYAVVFKATDGVNQFAIRCFINTESENVDRYRSISNYLKSILPIYLAKMQLLDNEIRVIGELYPIIKMEWVEGLLINNFVDQILNNNNSLTELQEQLVWLSNQMERDSIGHGDIQCGNLIVTKDWHGKLAIKLIDYDGMYIPEFKGKACLERGRSEFQHPQRDTQSVFDEKIDRFSFWVMITAIEAIKYDKTLWKEVMQGGFNTLDNFLFAVDDFKNPFQSKLFQRLQLLNRPSLSFYIDKLRSFCAKTPQEVEAVIAYSGSVDYNNSAITPVIAPQSAASKSNTAQSNVSKPQMPGNPNPVKFPTPNIATNISAPASFTPTPVNNTASALAQAASSPAVVNNTKSNKKIWTALFLTSLLLIVIYFVGKNNGLWDGLIGKNLKAPPILVVGQHLDGGIVYWVDSSGQNGLIADEHDLGSMSWKDAMRACQNKGNGWHLPTKEELLKLYENKYKVSGLENDWYWSSSESGSGSWVVDLRNSGTSIGNLLGSTHVRAVRAFGGNSGYQNYPPQDQAGSNINNNSQTQELSLVDSFEMTFRDEFTKCLNTSVGDKYKIIVKGTFDVCCDIPGGKMDAAFARTKELSQWKTVNLDFMKWNNVSIRPSDNNYNPNHVYVYDNLISNSSNQCFHFSDSYYGDNCGSLFFEVYKYKNNNAQTQPNPPQDQAGSTSKYYVGQHLDGGIVYWVDSSGQNGLMADDHDLGEMNWEEAKRACEAKGNGWHLPTKEELQKLYENKYKVSGLKTNGYWSSSENGTYNAWFQYFASGSQNYSIKNNTAYVRAVRAF